MHRGHKVRRRSLGLAAGLVFLAAGLAWLVQAGAFGLMRNDVNDLGAVPAATPSQSAAAASAAAAPTGPPLLVTRDTGMPQRLLIDGIDADQPIVPVQVDAEAVLGVPEDPQVIGWWEGGAAPGAGTGTVVFDAHTDSRQYGKGPLSRARELQPGDRATVISEGGTREYAVDAIREYEKVVLPWEELFAQDVEERMILITCGGDFDPERRSYRSNIVVFFTPV
jgi:sortase (surface protein transpeptidase)